MVDHALTDAALGKAIAEMNRERRLRREIAALMKSDSPPLTGLELLGIKSIILCIPEDLARYEKLPAQLRGRRLDPAVEKRTRVLLTGVPMPHGAERVVEIIENSGGLVVCQENCTGLKPIMEDVDAKAADPLLAIAEKYFHLPCSVMTPNMARFDLLRQLIAGYRPQCVVEVIWQACITYDIESFQVREFVEKEMNLPYLRIETDYSPSDNARIAMRVQALFETAGGHRRQLRRCWPGGRATFLSTRGEMRSVRHTSWAGVAGAPPSRRTDRRNRSKFAVEGRAYARPGRIVTGMV
jgi:benzoyl-CoA reductase/2-hydroxyglutaryl-CoA dehydratase subunit BcrC/BadD/HgdB